MRNTLQYLYTILVFTGALTTSYLMVSQSELRNQTRTAQNIDSTSSYRREAAFDSSVTKLFEVESALSSFPTTSSRTPAVDPFQRFEKKNLPNAPAKATSHPVGERAHSEDSSAGFNLLR
jgi:hypothetical protein